MQLDDVNDLSATEALEAYRDLQIEIGPTIALIKALEKHIKAEVKETGELVTVDGAYTKFGKGYTRTSWDNRGLRGYAVAHPEIMEFCKETEVGPTVSIKIEAA